MKKSEYLRKYDQVQVASNHEEHANRKGSVLNIYTHSPKGTASKDQEEARVQAIGGPDQERP